MIGLVEAIKDLREQIKRLSQLDRQQMRGESATSLEKAARAHETRNPYQILKKTTGKRQLCQRFSKTTKN